MIDERGDKPAEGRHRAPDPEDPSTDVPHLAPPAWWKDVLALPRRSRRQDGGSHRATGQGKSRSA